MTPSDLARGNLFDDLASTTDGERVDVLHASSALRIERVVSHGQRSPEGSWYDQAEDEWVLLVSGSAVLEFEGQATSVQLVPGDWVFIAARRRHRVVFTATDAPSVWVTVWQRGE